MFVRCQRAWGEGVYSCPYVANAGTYMLHFLSTLYPVITTCIFSSLICLPSSLSRSVQFSHLTNPHHPPCTHLNPLPTPFPTPCDGWRRGSWGWRPSYGLYPAVLPQDNETGKTTIHWSPSNNVVRVDWHETYHCIDPPPCHALMAFLPCPCLSSPPLFPWANIANQDTLINVFPEKWQMVQDDESRWEHSDSYWVPGEGRQSCPHHLLQPTGAAHTHHHLPTLNKDKG